MIKVHKVQLWVCEMCLAGIGEVCNVPGCAFCRMEVWDPVPPELYEIVETEIESDED